MQRSTGFSLLLITALAATSLDAQRERTRPTWNSSTTVTDMQATELTLTLTETAVRPIQVWVRIAGVIDAARRVITATVSPSDGARIKVGQRVRIFSPESRSRMSQASISQVVPRPPNVVVTATIAGQAVGASRHYILEIVTEDSQSLSVPNEAIIETGGRQIVYVHQADGGYAPRDIKVGVQGELFSQVLEGLAAGEQVVTFGSFFIDAEHKLKGS